MTRIVVDVNWAGTALDVALDPADGDYTLKRARTKVRLDATTRNGGHCPCCGQDVKVYRRTLTASMALALVMVHRWSRTPDAETTQRWLHVAKHLASLHTSASVGAAWHGGDWSKLRYWGLIEAQAGVRPDGSHRVGLYRITDLGRAFVERRTKVPKYCYIYAQTFLGLDEPNISIDEALGERFSLDDIMMR